MNMLIISRRFSIGLVCGAVAFSAVGLGCDCDAVISPNEPGRWGVEVAGVYNRALKDIRRHSPAPRIDTWGADVTGLYRVSGQHFVSCRFSYAYGAEDGFKLHQFALVPGYRDEWVLNEPWSAYAGAGIGIGVAMLDYPGMQHRHYALSRKDDMANVVYGVKLGTSYAIFPRGRVGCSVGLNGGTAPFHSASFSDATEEQVNLSLRVLLRLEF
jgi:hypothetical protein